MTLAAGMERQVGTSLEDIRIDHRARYEWAESQLKTTKYVLDAGCGVGYGTRILSSSVEKILGIDASLESIEFAREHWAADNIEYNVQDLHLLDLENEVFDGVVSFEVIEHLAMPELFLSRVHKAMTRQGLIFASSPNESVIPWNDSRNPFHFRHYTQEQFRQLFESVGFNVKCVASQSEDGTIFADSLHKYLLIVAEKVERESEVYNDVNAFLPELLRRYSIHTTNVGVDTHHVKQQRKQFRERVAVLERFEADCKALEKTNELQQKAIENRQNQIEALREEIRMLSAALTEEKSRFDAEVNAHSKTRQKLTTAEEEREALQKSLDRIRNTRAFRFAKASYKFMQRLRLIKN